MSRVDVSKNRDELVKAHKEVSNPKGSKNWALYTYEGPTNVLKLVETGDGGIEELVDELSSGKIMYAYCRVTDPNSGLPKFVLINWQGEGVPEMRKGSCANHIRDIENLLRGAHVTIMARSEDDVEEEDILKLVAKSSGANFGVHKEKARPDDGQIGPVGTNYKKINPQAAISNKKREDFWTKQQEEEHQRQEDDSRKLRTQKSVLEEERRDREAQETKEREAREAERLKEIRAIKAAEAQANKSNKENINWEQQQNDALTDAEERSRRSEQMRKERAAEAASLIGGSKQSARAVFEQKTSQFDNPKPTGPPPSRKLKHSFGSQEEPDQPPGRKAPIQLPQGDDQDDEHEAPPPRPSQRAPMAPPPRQPSPPPARQPSPPPARAPSPPPARQPSPPPPRQAMMPPSEGPKVRNLLAEGLPVRQDSDEEEAEEDDWGEDEQVVQSPTRVPESVPQSYLPEETYEEFPQASAGASEPLEEDEVLAQQDQYFGGGGTDQGLVARALYDYQAAEDNEITFDPEDIISNIEKIDDGWWIGTGPDGRHGMFPANYVELLNDS